MYDPEDAIEAFMEMEDFGGCTIPECGCFVEPDGVCPCGNESPLLAMGLI